MKHKVVVMLRKVVESAKFGIVLEKYSKRVAYTDDYARFYVEADRSGTILVVVDGKDLELVDQRSL